MTLFRGCLFEELFQISLKTDKNRAIVQYQQRKLEETNN